MMDEPIIELKNITKKFRLTKNMYGIKDAILHLPRFFHEICHPMDVTVLQNVSLTINRGDAVGLIGSNGSGKTTLLSVIGGVLKNFEGTRRVNGRISMMLALRSGFSNELSGRENIILNGVLQGIPRKKMEKLSPEIIEFAGLGPFIDAPVYQYSSGMLARLGFGIATAIEPEILLVDEVTSVGDEDFKEKCQERMQKFLSNKVTFILVSHKMKDIETYCTRVVKLDHGRIVADMPVKEFFAKGGNDKKEPEKTGNPPQPPSPVAAILRRRPSASLPDGQEKYLKTIFRTLAWHSRQIELKNKLLFWYKDRAGTLETENSKLREDLEQTRSRLANIRKKLQWRRISLPRRFFLFLRRKP